MQTQANDMIYTVKELRRTLIRLESEQDEAEGYLETLGSFRYIDQDLIQAIREGYVTKIGNTKQEINDISSNLENMGFAV